MFKFDGACESFEVTACAASGSSHRSGAADFSGCEIRDRCFERRDVTHRSLDLIEGPAKLVEFLLIINGHPSSLRHLSECSRGGDREFYFVHGIKKLWNEHNLHLSSTSVTTTASLATSILNLTSRPSTVIVPDAGGSGIRFNAELE